MRTPHRRDSLPSAPCSRLRRGYVGESLRDSHGMSWQSSSERNAVRLNRTITSHPRLGETRPRPGVTLIELLVTMLIITILAGLILGVASVAGETARKSQTRLTVQRLHKLMMEHYDTYKTRRVKVRQEVLQGINAKTSWSAAKKGQARAAARLYALRELMLMEIPDRWSDVTLTTSGPPLYPYFLDVSGSATGRTDLSSVYLRRYLQNTPSTDNQGAECLYLIITLATGDGEARSLFGENAIGDTDGDGAFEFLDAWKRPINFLRWAPGFDSQIQIDANTLDTPPTGTPQEAWAAAASGDHDPFDTYRVDPTAFRLIPLIFSGGGDETFGIRTADSYVRLGGLPKSQLNASSDPDDDWLDYALKPYAKVTDPDLVYLGTDLGEGSKDNVHNHLLGLR